jgi:D-3-phosphoglycerate dehydrogenase
LKTVTFNILLATPLSEDGMKALSSAQDVRIGKTDTIPLADADALIAGEEMVVDKSLLKLAPRLKLIGRAGASLTGIDLDEATRRGIIVMNTPGVDAVTVAEYTFAMLLAVTRYVVHAHNAAAIGQLDNPLLGKQLKGKTLGIIGFGRVGKEMAHRATAFGMEVLATDPFVAESQVAGLKLKLVGMRELLERADIVSLHTTLTPETHHILNAQTLALTQPGVVIINTKDTHLIDEPALLEMLNNGHVGGFATDVIQPGSSLLRHPKVIHTQRMRYNTVEVQRDLSVLIAEQVLDALHGIDFRNAVNLPFMDGYETLAPLMDMGEKIGMLEYYLGHHAPIKRIEISVIGSEMADSIKPITVAILRGLLAPALGNTVVNYINAPVIAAERNIFVTQTKGREVSPYPNLLTCRVLWEDDGDIEIAGALFNQTEPRIVQVDRYRTDFTPEGIILVMGSYDVPGVIGRVGTFMAENHINIAGWRTSRVEKGGNTLSIISIDEPLSDELLNELRSNEFVRHATQIIFD